MTKQKPRERLEKTLARVAREQGLDQERLRRWVSFLALCGALDRAIEAGILSGYYLKGGVAMELRFAEHARATKDLDLGMEGARADGSDLGMHWEQDSMSSPFGSKLKPATWNMQTRFASRWRFNIERDHGRRLRLTSAPPKPIKSI